MLSSPKSLFYFKTTQGLFNHQISKDIAFITLSVTVDIACVRYIPLWKQKIACKQPRLIWCFKIPHGLLKSSELGSNWSL